MKHQIKYVIIHNKILDENELKNEISRLLSECEHGHNMHEHRKIVKQMNHTNLFLWVSDKSSTNQVFLQTYITEFDDIIKFTGYNGRSLEKENNICFTFLINK